MPFTDSATGFLIKNISDPVTTISFIFSDSSSTILAKAELCSIDLTSEDNGPKILDTFEITKMMHPIANEMNVFKFSMKKKAGTPATADTIILEFPTNLF